MPKFRKNIEVPGVDRIHRPGVGYVYKGTISIGDLAEGLEESMLKYAPKYQRGAADDFDEKTLLDVTDEKLEIDPDRAAQMAAKYLMGRDASHADPDEAVEFFNPDVIWNARDDGNGGKELEYDKKSRTLVVHSTITIPDSAHRHYMAYLLHTWKNNIGEIPDEVQISDDGRSVDTDTLRKLIKDWDPYDEEHSSVFVTVFNVTPDYEGKLFDEYNVAGKRPTAGAAIDMHPTKTASRRFVTTLMKRCKIFDRDEVEIRRSTIAKASRKITTLATLDSAIKPFQKELLKIQQNKEQYDDLLDFFSHFFTEWATHYTEFQPTASGKARQDLRESSFAMSNIMFFPMFRLAFELWSKYTKSATDWKSETEWKDGLAKLAGDVATKDKDGTPFTGPIMARDHTDENGTRIPGNPDWHGLILIQQFDQNGKPTGWSLSSTRQTRDAAYYYLAQKSGVDLDKK